MAPNIIAETYTTEISNSQNPKGFHHSAEVARRGGQIAGEIREKQEAQVGLSVISDEKASDYLPPADRWQELPEEDDGE